MVFLLCWQVLPRLKYTLLTFDKFYFGVFVDKMPELAVTTTHKNYMIAHNKPFRTTADLNQGHREYEERLAKGIEHPWNEEYYDQPSILGSKLQSGINMAQDTIRSLRRRLEGDGATAAADGAASASNGDGASSSGAATGGDSTATDDTTADEETNPLLQRKVLSLRE